MRTVAIVGASSDRRKFGNKSIRAHAAAGWQVFPIHPKETVIEGLTAYPSVALVPVDRLDRVSVYLPPQVCLSILDSFLSKRIDEIWLNPGADAPEVIDALTARDLNVVTVCSIVDVGFSPSQFS